MTAITRTTCPYCGVGCGIVVGRDTGGNVTVSPDKKHPANLGRLCSKGTALPETIDHPERLLYPEMNGQRISWALATTTIADRFLDIIARHGADAVAFYVSGQLLTEDYYVANKLMKGFIGSANIDTNSRLCMSSAVTAHKRAFGEDLVPCSYEDLEQAELLVLVGSNAAWCHPVLFQRMVRAKQANPKLQVVAIDPRRTQTSDIADLHLGLAPGTDAILFNGLLIYLADHGHIANSFVTNHTHGSGTALAMARASSPDTCSVAGQTHLDEADVRYFFSLFASSKKVVTVFSQGINQSSSGSDKGNAIINCHLLTGRMGQPGMGVFSFTGQPNAMGGREVGGLANQLAAHLDIENPRHRDLVQRFWQSSGVAQSPGLKAVDLFHSIEAGTVKAVWIMATNPAVSLPDSEQVRRALTKCELVVVSDCVRNTDTMELAHIRLPALTWGERNGTVTNTERCISRQRPFLPAPGEARQDWEIVRDVAQAMGFAEYFPYQSAYEIFREHAALSVFENGGERCFNLGAWQNLTAAAYDELQPTQWPVDAAGQGTSRLFTDGKYFTSTGKAQFIAVQPCPPQSVRTPEYPFVLNTGRVRDHWHTMTRTGISSRLSAHSSEPYVEVHPEDAITHDLQDGAIARIHNTLGEIRVRVKLSQYQQVGSLFVPMHWSKQFSAMAGVGRLIPAVVDPASGQPESKHTTVAIQPYPVTWHGFLISRRHLCLETDYWTVTKVNHAQHYHFASTRPITDWAVFARSLLCQHDCNVNWTEYLDTARQTYRAARFTGGMLESCLFISSATDTLPPQEWLIGLFSHDQLSVSDRTSLLAGKPAIAGEDKGHTVCACFNVGENTLRKAITEQGLKTTEDIGRCLKAGTNCGSCLPELRTLLEQ